MEERKYFSANRLYKCPNHSGNLNDMRLNKEWCDVTIRVNTREFPAHKVILAANLKYFKSMFSNDSFQESKEGVIINMDVMEEEDLEAFLSYAYTGELLLTENNALNFLKVANYLSESGIKEACVQFLNKHLRKEEACQAYQLATVLACPSLKNRAKAIITMNFENCSKSLDYLNFGIENLIDILSDGKAQSVKQQQLFFKGIVRWIMFDPSNRKIHLNHSLSLIDLPTLTADFLIDCLHRNIDSNDEHGIIKNITFRYHTSKIEQEKSEKSLLIVGFNDLFINSNLLLQYYSFTKKKWTSLQEVPGAIDEIPKCSGILYGKVYYINKKLDKLSLKVFDPATKEITELNSTGNIFQYAAFCACSKFLYLCGGRDTRNNVSNQVLRYDPLRNSFENLTAMGTRRSSAMATTCRGFLYIFGGLKGTTWVNSVEKYDLNLKQWTAVASMCQPRYRFGVTVLDEKIYVCGGLLANGVPISSVEVYDPVQNSWQRVASMNKSRHTFAVVAHKGTLVSFGGDISSTEQSVEVYHPSKDQWRLDHEMSAGFHIQHPIGGLITSSCVLEGN